ncbi:MAG: hypothetical protein HY996_07255 [Micrococcales bacterium]|nr:hypothetical protein [Micrococcales bacterium]
MPLARDLFQSVRFLDIAPKMEGVGKEEKQAHDKEGTPRWVVSALVRHGETKQETETFTLTAPLAVAEKINEIEELTPIRLRGLAGGKWTRVSSDKTSWSFQIAGVEVAS